MSLHKFGETGDGATVYEIRLTLPSGATASILNFGAILRDLQIPLADGSLRRVVLGFRDFVGYLADRSFMGVIAGRCANRIAGGRFRLDGVDYQLTCNDAGGRHHVHGGPQGFSRQVWSIVAHDESSAVLELTSPAGQEGYPGTVVARCAFRLRAPAILSLTMTAESDAATLVNLAHHSYFNLGAGASSGDHCLQVQAANHTPVDAEKIPTGVIVPVAGTVYDFRKPARLAEQMGAARLDMNFVLDRAGEDLAPAATVWSPDRRLAMEVLTTEPGLQVYDGSGLQPSHPGLDGQLHGPRAGLCLEPQIFPDAINHPGFPSPILRPGEIYRQVSDYRFQETS